MRSPSAFAAMGVVLAGLSLAGIWWIALRDEPSLSGLVRLGTTGIVAATIGWASLAAREPVIAACRAVIGVAVYATCSLLGAWTIERHAPFDTPLDGSPSYVKVFIDWPAMIHHLSIKGGVVFAAALAAVCTVRGPRRLRPVFMLGALLPVVYETLTLATDGAEVAAMLGAFATAWLIWAIRRASANMARTDRVKPDGSFIESA